jgi:hypothetical protein
MRHLHHLIFKVDRSIGEGSTEIGEAQCVVKGRDGYDAIELAMRHLEADGWRFSEMPTVRLIDINEVTADPVLKTLIRSARQGGVVYDTVTREVPLSMASEPDRPASG